MDLSVGDHTSIFKPEIIEQNGNVYANYGNMLYVFQQSTGKELFSYSPIINDEQYIILNIEIYKDALYGFVVNNEALTNRNKMRLFFFKLNIFNFEIVWTQQCLYSMTRYFFVHDEIYLFNITLSLTCCFERYDLETGDHQGRIELPLQIDEDWILASMPSYNQELNEVWVYLFQDATKNKLFSTLQIHRFDIETGDFVEPITISIDPYYNIHLNMFSLYPLLYKKNLLFAEYRKDNKYEIIKINTKTKMIDWIDKNEEVVQEIILNPVDRSTLYLREGLNTYRKINLHNKNTIQTWHLKELEKNFYSYSASSCVNNIIATRFVHSLVIFDVKTEKVLWFKKSEKPDRYKDVAEIGFSPPIIKKLNQNKYQILYSLEDQIGLLEINLQS